MAITVLRALFHLFCQVLFVLYFLLVASYIMYLYLAGPYREFLAPLKVKVCGDSSYTLGSVTLITEESVLSISHVRLTGPFSNNNNFLLH